MNQALMKLVPLPMAELFATRVDLKEHRDRMRHATDQINNARGIFMANVEAGQGGKNDSATSSDFIEII